MTRIFSFNSRQGQRLPKVHQPAVIESRLYNAKFLVRTQTKNFRCKRKDSKSGIKDLSGQNFCMKVILYNRNTKKE